MRWWVVAAAGLYASVATADPIDDLIALLGRFKDEPTPVTALLANDQALVELGKGLEALGYSDGGRRLKIRLMRLQTVSGLGFRNRGTPTGSGPLSIRPIPTILAGLLDPKITADEIRSMRSFYQLVRGDHHFGFEIESPGMRRFVALGGDEAMAAGAFDLWLAARKGSTNPVSVSRNVADLISEHPAIIGGRLSDTAVRITPDSLVGIQSEADIVAATRSPSVLAETLFPLQISQDQQKRLAKWYVKHGEAIESGGINPIVVRKLIEKAQAAGLLELAAAVAKNAQLGCAARSAQTAARAHRRRPPDSGEWGNIGRGMPRNDE